MKTPSAALIFACLASPAQSQVRMLSGMEPDKFSTNILHLNPGSASDFYGTTTIHFNSDYTIDLTTVGPGGLDTGSVSNGEYYVYLLQKTSDLSGAAVVSRSRLQGDVVVPPGYTWIRKLPWGFVYNTAWDGIPNFLIAHWPMPLVRFTDAQYQAPWMACVVASCRSQTWTTVDLTGYLPDTARAAMLATEVREMGTTACSGYVSSTGHDTGLFVGSASPNQPSSVMSLTIRVTSDRRLFYYVSPGCGLGIEVLGYLMSDPS